MIAKSSAVLRSADRGAVAVEFALILPILIVLVFGIIDFGRAFNAQVTLSQAAREGARVAALCAGTSTCGTVTARTTAAAPNLTGMTVAVTRLCAVGDTQTTDAVVTVSWTLRFSTPMVGLVGLPTTKVLTGTGHMPCQG
jgi:Flp pilus assembly protein TadG